MKKEIEKKTQDEVNLTPKEHKKALKQAYKSFVVPELSKAGIEDFVDYVKLYVKASIETQLMGMQSTKMIAKLWERWKKPGK